MKITSLLFALFLLVACLPTSNKNSTISTQSVVAKQDTPTDSITEVVDTLSTLIQTSDGFSTWTALVKKTDLDSTASEQQIKELLPVLFPYSIDTVKNIKRIVKTHKKVNIYNFGEATLYDITLIDGLSMAVLIKHCLVWNSKQHKIALLPIENYQLIKAKVDTNTYLIGGFFNQRRGYIHYLAYAGSFDNNRNTFEDFFNTVNYCDHGLLHVGNSSYDCLSYEPFVFNLSNEDVNKDGYADLRFTGTFNVYCDSMFQEDRRISNPVKKVPADIVFYTQVKEKQWEWVFKDTSLCSFLQKISENFGL